VVPEDGNPVVAVVVTYESGATIGECLAALARELRPDDAIAVVDNASPGGPEAVERAARAITATVLCRFIAMPTNAGFGSGCNRGAQEFPAHDVLLVNPDAVVQAESVSRLRAFLRAEPRYGAVGPRIERFDGRLEPGCRRTLPRPGVAFGRLSRLDRLMPERFGSYNRLEIDPSLPTDLEAASGACVLIQRAAWDSIGGFDPRFFMYGEDLDLFLRLGERGWLVRYLPEARVLHHKGASTDAVPMRMLFEFHRAMWRYYRKHHMHGASAMLAPVVLAGLGSRFVALSAVQAVRRGRSRRQAAAGG